jgi:iron complex outermembrane receptor protein
VFVAYRIPPRPPESRGTEFTKRGDIRNVRGTSAPGAPGGLSPANCDISGGRLPGVSKWSFTYGAEANTPVTLLGREGETYVGFEGSYRSGFSSNPSPSAYTNVEGYTLANFRAGFRTEDGLNLFAWVRNAFDEEYFEQLALGPSSTGLIVGQPGDPRTVGVTVRVGLHK